MIMVNGVALSSGVMFDIEQFTMIARGYKLTSESKISRESAVALIATRFGSRKIPIENQGIVLRLEDNFAVILWRDKNNDFHALAASNNGMRPKKDAV